MPDLTLQTDGEGNVILQPVTAWIVRDAAMTNVVAAFRFAHKDESTGEVIESQVQLVLKPEQAHELAKVLSEISSAILAPQTQKHKPN